MSLEEFNYTTYKQLVESINSDESLYNLLEELGYKPSQSMNCIFHADRTPSFRVSEAKGKWHCFSCGRGGGYIELLYLIYKDLEGGKMSKIMFVEALLSKHKDWQKKYGITSLKSKLEFSPNTIKYLFDYKRTTKRVRANTADSVVKEGEILNKRHEAFSNLAKIPIEHTDEIISFLGKIQNGDIPY